MRNPDQASGPKERFNDTLFFSTKRFHRGSRRSLTECLLHRVVLNLFDFHIAVNPVARDGEQGGDGQSAPDGDGRRFAPERFHASGRADIFWKEKKFVKKDYAYFLLYRQFVKRARRNYDCCLPGPNSSLLKMKGWILEFLKMTKASMSLDFNVTGNSSEQV